MKKILLTAVFLVVCFSVFAEEKSSILSAEFQFKGGYMPIDKLDFNNATGYNEPNFFTELQVRLFVVNLFFIEGGMNCHFALQQGNANFTPYFIDFNFGGGLKIGALEVGYRHDCFHPILDFNVLNSSLSGGGFDMFYISFKGTMSIL